MPMTRRRSSEPVPPAYARNRIGNAATVIRALRAFSGRTVPGRPKILAGVLVIADLNCQFAGPARQRHRTAHRRSLYR